MTCIVLDTCIDKETGKQYKKGDIIEISPERYKTAPKGYLKQVRKKKGEAL